MEPLEWIAIIGAIASIGSSIFSGIKENERYDAETSFRDNVYQRGSVQGKFEDLKSIGANDSFALQAVGGLNPAGYVGTSYNQPVDYGAQFANLLSSLSTAFKAPAEKENIETDTEGKKIDNEDRKEMNQEKIKNLKADTDKKKKDGKLSEANANRIEKMLELDKGKAISEIKKNYSEIANNFANVAATLEGIDIAKREISLAEHKGEAEIDKINAETQNIKGQTDLQKDTHAINMQTLVNMYTENKLNVLREVLIEAQTKHEMALSVDTIINAIGKDFENKLRQGGLGEGTQSEGYDTSLLWGLIHFGHNKSASREAENKDIKENSYEYDFVNSLKEASEFLNEYTNMLDK